MPTKFVDRIPETPNRYLVTPEDGSPPYYVYLYRADGAVEEGTPLNAATLNNMVTRADCFQEKNKAMDISFWVGTQAEYDAITDKGESRLYLISDDGDLNGVTNFVANAADLNGNGMAFDSTVTLTDPGRIAALFKHKMALVRAAGQTVLCSVQTATITSAAPSDNIIHISGCAANTYANPVTITPSYAINPVGLIVVDIRVDFPGGLSPDATEIYITNYSRRQGLGSDAVEGVNVWRIDLLNATQY